jgi:hypothetical protein
MLGSNFHQGNHFLQSRISSRFQDIRGFDILRFAPEQDVNPKGAKRKSSSGHLYLGCWMFLRTAGDQLGYLPYGVDDGEELDKVVSDILLFNLRLRYVWDLRYDTHLARKGKLRPA